MKKISALFWILLLISIFVPAQKIELVNGVRVIHNGKGGKWGSNPEVKKDGNTSWHANYFVFDTDAEKNICIGFQWQNRIEKYAPDGKLLWRAEGYCFEGARDRGAYGPRTLLTQIHM